MLGRAMDDLAADWWKKGPTGAPPSAMQCNHENEKVASDGGTVLPEWLMMLLAVHIAGAAPLVCVQDSC